MNTSSPLYTDQKGNGLIYILLGVFILIVILFYIKITCCVLSGNNITVTTPPSSISLDTSNWKTYTSTLFSFKYPPQVGIGHIDLKNYIEIRKVTNNETTQDFFNYTKYEPEVQFGTTFPLAIQNHPAFVRKVTVNNTGYPINNITEISIEKVKFYKDEQWFTNGNLFLSIHIDGDKNESDNIAKLIIDSIQFNDINQANITFKEENLESTIPVNWWYECAEISGIHHIQSNDIQCKIDTTSNVPPENFGEPEIIETDKCDDLNWFPLDILPENIIPYIRSAIQNVRDNNFYSELGWNK